MKDFSSTRALWLQYNWKQQNNQIYETISLENYDEDGYLNLKEIVYELFPTDEVFKNVILKDFVEKKYYATEENEENISEEHLDFKLSKENLKRNIGVFVLCRFKTTMGVENNCDNIGANFSLNKIYCYYDPEAQRLNSSIILKASEAIKEKYQSFLDEYVSKNPHLENFIVSSQK